MRAAVADIEPIARTVAFRLAPELAARWNGGSIVRSALLNALSIFLPAGENLFVRTVRATQAAGCADARGVNTFVVQESAHRRQHELYNACLQQRFPSTGRWLWYMDRSWAFKSAMMSPRARLAATVAIEHLTTLMARLVLSERSAIEGADLEYASLWRWHALEELEHKSVAFQLYFAQGGSRRRLMLMMIIVSAVFAVEFLCVLAALLGDQKRLYRRQTRQDLRAIWRSRAAREARAGYVTFFAKAFSPALVDDSDLVLRWRSDAVLAAHFLKPRN